MTRSGMHEDVPREEFKAWKDARPKAQSIPENVQEETAPVPKLTRR